jgi:hypothetical protein
MLNEDGVMISFDLTHIVKQKKYWFLRLFSDSDLTVWLVVVINISAILYLKFFRMRNNSLADLTQRRSNEINQVMRDIVRLNDLQQAMTGQNLIDPNLLQPVN